MNVTPASLSRCHHPKYVSGSAWVELILGCLLLVMITSNAVRGYQLMQQSKAAHLHYQAEQMVAAWHEFYDRYQALPGDYAYAQTGIDSSLINGNGNGQIDTDIERGQVWAHLAAVGLLSGAFDGKPQSLAESCPASRCPDTGFDQGFMLGYSSELGNFLFAGRHIPIHILTELDQQIDDGKANQGKMRLDPACESPHYSSTKSCAVIFPIF